MVKNLNGRRLVNLKTRVVNAESAEPVTFKRECGGNAAEHICAQTVAKHFKPALCQRGIKKVICCGFAVCAAGDDYIIFNVLFKTFYQVGADFKRNNART